METDTAQTLAFSARKELVSGWLTMFVVGSDLFVVSPLLPLIARDYEISPSLAGLSVTVFSFIYMLSAPILGHMADKIGRVRVLTGCLCVFGAANLLTSAAPDLNWLLAARLVAGSAAAGVTPSIYALVGARAPHDKRATWLAIVVSGLLMSLSFGAPIGGLTGAAFGWPTVFAGLGGLSLLLVWANSRAWHDKRAPTDQMSPPGRLTPAAVAMRLMQTVAWSAAVYTVYTYLGAGLTSAGYSTEEVAEVILFYGCGAIAGALIGGRVTDQLGPRPTIAIGLASLCFCLLLLRLALDACTLVDAAFALSSAVAQLFFPAQQVRLAQEFPTRRATVLAWNNSALFLGIALGSLIGGWVISVGGFDANLMISAAVAMVGWLINRSDGPRLSRAVTQHRSPRRLSGTPEAR